MKDHNSLHARLQQYNDCFAEADPRAELRKIASRGIAGEHPQDLTELALKYLSLSILTGVDAGAAKVFYARKGDQNGSCVLAGPRQDRLPAPPTGVAQEIIEILRRIAGLEQDKAYGALACGVRQDTLRMDVGVARSGDRETLSLTLLES